MNSDGNQDEAESVVVVTVIHCWSAPRSRSTALLYSFEAARNHHHHHTGPRSVTTASATSGTLLSVALDEPLYATWLRQESQQLHSNITRPYLPYVRKAAGLDDDNNTDDHAVSSGTENVATGGLDPTLLLEWQEELQPFPMKLQKATETLLLQQQQQQGDDSTASSSSSSSSTGSPNKVIFCKHMAKFWSVYDRQRDEVPEVILPPSLVDGSTNNPTHVRLRHCHVLLLRDPVDVVTSWNAIGSHVYGTMAASSGEETGGNTIQEIGMVPLLQIYSALQTTTPTTTGTTTTTNSNNNNNTGTTSSLSGLFVMDAEELIQNPEPTLQRLCRHCQIPYTNAMMSWNSGPHACDGPWAKYWYHDVHQTTGWISTTKTNEAGSVATTVVTKQKYRTFNPTYLTALRASYPAYTFLYHLTERYQQRTTLSIDELYPDDKRNEQIFVYIGNSPGYGQCVPRDMAGVSPFDSVVQGGDATWEGIRIYRGKILCLEKHLNRLMKSAKALGFNMRYLHTKEQITDAIFQVLAINNMRDGAHMRLTLTRGEKCTSSMNPNFNVYGTTLIIVPEWKPVHGVTTYDNTTGISLITASQRRNPPSCVDSKIHHNNLINNILPKIQANLAGVADAIMLDIDGYVSETNATNLFMVDDAGTLLTPPADHCLPGITRGAVLELARELGIPTNVRRISLAEFHSADEVFTTGTMGELTPVVTIDGRTIGTGTGGPITQQLQQIYQTLPDRDGWSTPIPPFD